MWSLGVHALGLSTQAQLKKLTRDPSLDDVLEKAGWQAGMSPDLARQKIALAVLSITLLRTDSTPQMTTRMQTLLTKRTAGDDGTVGYAKVSDLMKYARDTKDDNLAEATFDKAATDPMNLRSQSWVKPAIIVGAVAGGAAVAGVGVAARSSVWSRFRAAISSIGLLGWVASVPVIKSVLTASRQVLTGESPADATKISLTSVRDWAIAAGIAVPVLILAGGALPMTVFLASAAATTLQKFSGQKGSFRTQGLMTLAIFAVGVMWPHVSALASWGSAAATGAAATGAAASTAWQAPEWIVKAWTATKSVTPNFVWDIVAWGANAFAWAEPKIKLVMGIVIGGTAGAVTTQLAVKGPAQAVANKLTTINGDQRENALYTLRIDKLAATAQTDADKNKQDRVDAVRKEDDSKLSPDQKKKSAELQQLKKQLDSLSQFGNAPEMKQFLEAQKTQLQSKISKLEQELPKATLVEERTVVHDVVVAISKNKKIEISELADVMADTLEKMGGDPSKARFFAVMSFGSPTERTQAVTEFENEAAQTPLNTLKMLTELSESDKPEMISMHGLAALENLPVSSLANKLSLPLAIRYHDMEQRAIATVGKFNLSPCRSRIRQGTRSARSGDQSYIWPGNDRNRT